jgi:hypothetical protein
VAIWSAKTGGSAIRTSNEIDELFAKFEQEPAPGQKGRAEILLALLAAHDGKMPVKEARQKMKVSKTIFSRLLSTMKDMRMIACSCYGPVIS